jgi:hypothetical protein
MNIKSTKSIKPIFLISQPRAGSTLLQRIISSSKEIHTLSEPWFLLSLYDSYLKDNVSLTAYGYATTKDAIKSLIKNDKAVYNDAFRDSIRVFANNFYNKLSPKNTKYFLDKTPRYYYIINELARDFSDSKIIILYRNPLDVLSSMINAWGKGSFNHMHAYLDDLLIAPRKLIDPNLKKFPNIIYVNYEDLVSNPSKQIEILKSFFDNEIDLDTSSLNTIKIGGGSLGDEYQSKREIDKSSLNKFVKTINNPIRSIVFLIYLRYLGKEIISEMGYDYKNLEKKCTFFSLRRFSFKYLLKDFFTIIWGLIIFIFQPNIHLKRLKFLFRKKIPPYLQ